jgi:putative ABC transport system permease protein
VNTQFKLAWRYLRGRGLRSFLTTLAVVFGVMLIFGLNSIIPTMIGAFSRSLLNTAGKIDLSVTSAFNQPFGLDVLNKVERVQGIAVATPEVQRIAPVPVDQSIPAGERIAQLNVIGVDPATVERVREFPIVQGRVLRANDGDVVVLNSDLASQLRLKLGDTLTLPSSVGSARLTVVGLLSVATLPGQEQIFVPLGTAQRMFAFGSRINAVEASFKPDVSRAAVEAAVSSALGDRYTVGGLSTNTSLLASLNVSVYAFNMFGIFALATAGFIILNSFRTVVSERRRDVGMLRAIGAKRGTIIGMFLMESLFQGILGTALGIFAGWLMATGLFALLGPVFENVVHMRLGGVVFTIGPWIEAIVLGIGVTVAAAIIPARAAGRVTPMEAMRPQLGEVYERRIGIRAWIGVGIVVVSVFCLATGNSGLVGLGAVVFLIGIALVAPAVVNPIADAFGQVIELVFAREGAIARSNLQRNPGRSAITVTAVMLGLASIIAMLSVVSSIFLGFYNYIDKSLSADYMFIPQSIILGQGNVAAGPRLVDEVQHVNGIGPVSSLRIAQGKAQGGDVQVVGIDPAKYPLVANFEWNAPSTDQAYEQLRSGRWFIANGIYASQHKLVLGQALVIDTPNGPRTYHLAGIGNDYLNAKLATIYTSQTNLARDFNATADLLIFANRTAGADPTTVKAALDRIATDYPAFKLYESAQWSAEQRNTFSQTIVIFYALMAALALPSLLALVNTLAISVLARTREIGMLRAVGSTRRQIRRMVMAESLLLSIIGIAFGVIAGLWLGYALVVAMGAIGWVMPYVFPWGGIISTVVVGLVFGVLAALVPARSASRLDVVEALHFE